MRDVHAVDVAILAALTVFCAASLSHIVQTWLMRMDLEVHMRSPGLATLSGLSGTLIFLVTVFRFFLGISIEAGPFDLFFLPMLLTLYTGAYIMRGFRLLVMYNPHLRKRWGRCVKESVIMKTLVAAWVVLEVIVWLASSIVGVKRVADYTFVLFLSETLLTMAASIVLFGMLRRAHDIYKVSIEIQKLGAFALLALCSSSGYIAVQSPYLMLVWMMVRFQSALWITNIQPIRAILRRRAGREDDTVSVSTPLFPYLPWKTRTNRKVAIDAAGGTVAFRSQHTSCADAGSVLDLITHVPALLQAFEEYCRKALCSESLMFLLAAEDFAKRFEEVPAGKPDSYQKYLAIVDKFIRDRSPYEVNIESRIKREILRTTDRGIFDALSTTLERSKVLDPAVKEVGRVLKDNLYDKFRATKEYKQIQDQMDALDEVEE